MNFSKRFTSLLNQSGKSQKEVAAETGISPSALVNYKKGQIPKSSELFRLARYFNVTMEWLLSGEGERSIQDDEFSYNLTIPSTKNYSVTLDSSNLDEALDLAVKQYSKATNPDLRRHLAATVRRIAAELEDFEPEGERFPIELAGSVAAGDVEPDVPDGCVIVVREIVERIAPRKGSLVVVSDGGGSMLKRLAYRKDPNASYSNDLGTVPVLESINPSFPDATPLEGAELQAVLIDVFEDQI